MKQSCTYQTVGDVALLINVGGHDEGGILLSVLVQADGLQTNKEWKNVGRKEHYSTAIKNTHYEPQAYIFGLRERKISQKAQGLSRNKFTDDRCLRGFCWSVFSACTLESEVE